MIIPLQINIIIYKHIICIKIYFFHSLCRFWGAHVARMEKKGYLSLQQHDIWSHPHRIYQLMYTVYRIQRLIQSGNWNQQKEREKEKKNLWIAFIYAELCKYLYNHLYGVYIYASHGTPLAPAHWESCCQHESRIRILGWK